MDYLAGLAFFVWKSITEQAKDGEWVICFTYGPTLQRILRVTPPDQNFVLLLDCYYCELLQESSFPSYISVAT